MGYKKGLDVDSRSRKKYIIAKDMAINLLGTGIGMVVLQVVIYPIVAKSLDSDSYGLMQSIISIVYIFSGTLGSSLCTTRLVRENEYVNCKEKGDFNLLFVAAILFVIVLLPVVLFLYERTLPLYEIILIIAVAVFNFSSNYYEVGFRLRLDFGAIFINKLIGCIGYFVGFCFFKILCIWEFVFLISYILQTIFTGFRTKLYKEPYSKTTFFRESWMVYKDLSIANLLSRALTYVDKFLLYPMLGGTSVAIYYTANIMGKLVLMIVEPIANVILSHLSKVDYLSSQNVKKVIIISSISCLAMYCIGVIISPLIMSFLYPQWSEDVMPMIPITTLTLSISAFANLIYPFTLKLMKSSIQVLINGCGIMVYVVLVIILHKPYGILGCCFALLASYLVKVIVIFVCYYIECYDK